MPANHVIPSDYSGQRFGTLTVIRRLEPLSAYLWECRCDCGAVLNRKSSHLQRTRFCSHSCPLREASVKFTDPKTGLACPERFLQFPHEYTVRPCNRCGKDYISLAGAVLRGKEVYCSPECGVLPMPTKETLPSYIEIDPATGCWNWKHDINAFGRAFIYVPNGKPSKPFVSRLVWEMYHGKPGKKFVCHTCDNPRCVNIEHLFIGTPQDNVNDMIAKGRQCKGQNKKNAKLSEDNVRSIRSAYGAGAATLESLAETYRVSAASISLIVNRKSWKHIE